MQENDEIEIDLKELFLLLKEKKMKLLFAASLFGLLAGIFSQFVIQPKYSAVAKIFIEASGSSSIAGISLGEGLTQDYMELLYSRPVLEEAISLLGMEEKETYLSFKKKVKVDNLTDRVLGITATYKNPDTAADIANTVALVVGKRVSELTSTDAPDMVENAVSNPVPTEPSVTKNIIVAFIIGAVLSGGFYIAKYLMAENGLQTPENELQTQTE